MTDVDLKDNTFISAYIHVKLRIKRYGVVLSYMYEQVLE